MWGAPWPVIAFVALQLPLPINVLSGDDFNSTAATTLVLFVLLIVLLWRGSRVAWTILFLFEAFAVFVQPFDPAPWWAWALNAVGLALLLTPATRKHVWGGRLRRERAIA